MLAREPEAGEGELALRFGREAAAHGEAKLTPWEQYAQVLLLTNKRMFVG